MKNKKEIAKLIYDELEKGDTKLAISLITKELEEEKTDKLKFTKTPLLNSIGQELGKLLIKDSNPPTTLLPNVGTYWKFERLM